MPIPSELVSVWGWILLQVLMWCLWIDEDICTRCGRKMQQGHVDMIQW